MPQPCLNYSASEDKAQLFHCPLTRGSRFDISKSPPVCWAVLDALNNTIAPVGDEVGEG